MTEPSDPVPPTVGLKTILVAASLLLIVGAPLVVLGSISTEAVTRLPFVGIFLFLTLMLLVPLPLTFGLIVATGNADPRTTDGRVAFRRLLVISGTLVITLSGVLIATAATEVMSLIAAIVITLSVAAFTAGSIWLGEIIRRRDAARPPLTWPPLESHLAKLPQRSRWIYWSFIIAFAVTAAIFTVTVAITRDTALLGPGPLLNAVSIPLVLTGIVGSILSLTLASEVGTLLGTDSERQRRLSRAFRTLSVAELPPDERVAARRYAGATAALVPLQVAQFLFLTGGFTTMRVSSLLSPDDDQRPFDYVFLCFVVAATAFFVPFAAWRGRRLRRFAATTDEASLSSAPSP